MMYHRTTELQMYADAPEVLYWLSMGEKLFKHKNNWWLSLKHHKGHRIMIPVDEYEVLPKIKLKVDMNGIIITMKQKYRGLS